jgi:hypothetical protein
LADLRAAIAAQVNGASGDVGALRGAVAAVFSKFVVVPRASFGLPAEDPDAPEFEVVTQVRSEMVRDDDAGSYSVSRVPVLSAWRPTISTAPSSGST